MNFSAAASVMSRILFKAPTLIVSVGFVVASGSSSLCRVSSGSRIRSEYLLVSADHALSTEKLMLITFNVMFVNILTRVEPAQARSIFNEHQSFQIRFFKKSAKIVCC